MRDREEPRMPDGEGKDNAGGECPGATPDAMERHVEQRRGGANDTPQPSTDGKMPTAQ